MDECKPLLTGVSWHQSNNKWRATCKGKHLGGHTTPEDAARAYNVEAERVGRPLNVIQPTGASGAGASARNTGVGAGGSAGTKRRAPKTPVTPAMSKRTQRAAPTTPALPAPSKKMKL